MSKTSPKKYIVIVLVFLISTGSNANADFTFGTPTYLGPSVNSSSYDDGLTISTDSLTLFFASDRHAGRVGSWDIWQCTRETTEDEWGPAENLGSTVNSPQGEGYPSISADGLELYFCSLYWVSQRPGGSGGADLWVTRRASVSDDWNTPENLGALVNSASHESEPSISADGRTLYFTSNRGGGSGGYDLWVTTRPTTSDPWGAPVSLGTVVNSTGNDMGPCIFANDLALFFRSNRPGGYGRADMYITTRATTSDPWGEPVNLGPTINSSEPECTSYISPDGQILYFNVDEPYDFCQAPIIPIVDLNGDGIVDAEDMCIVVDYWGTDEPLCDIGPMPWGDGIVDVQDLIVLAEHLFEEPTLVAYWKLDETEGEIAYDTANSYDGTLQGEPTWQPEGGMVDGALQLDGIDDYVNTPFVLNPADGPFSAFAWVKGSAPGQVVLSQMGGVNWLCADTLEGNLMTELKGPGRSSVPLLSKTVITDGSWHRIGLVWDGSNRTLYVDDAAVVEDTQANLESSYNGFYIGTGKAMEPGTYWSSLIDDVRIYNRAIKP
ncbi:MAG: LamG-like jellyroll fold domain-containing protein [Sedimentisphaerales bacterium]